MTSPWSLKVRWSLAAIAATLAAFVGGWFVLRDGPEAGVQRLDGLAARAGCSRLHSETFHAGLVHIPEDEIARYTTSPPIGGAHYNVPGLAPAKTGVHVAPIQNEIQVHNLEHGQVGFQYRDISDELVAQLHAVAQADPRWVFVAPYRDMSSKIALTAWGRSITCSAPNARVGELARKFLLEFKDRAPESIPGTPRLGQHQHMQVTWNS